MATLGEVLDFLRHIAPEGSALPNDPVGLLIGGHADTEVLKVGVCLDATPEAAQRAVTSQAALLVAHHPLIYHPLKRLDMVADPTAQAVTALVKADIALYAMHTNWDRAEGGINDTLAGLLGLRGARRLGEHGEQALPRIGDLESPQPLADFARHVSAALSCSGTSALRVNAVDPARAIARVAVCGGAGASMADAVRAMHEALLAIGISHREAA